MELTPAEFCQFNIKSRMQLLEKDGVLIKIHRVLDKYIVHLYKLYQFMVEVIIKTQNHEILKVEPIRNSIAI